VGLPTGRYTLRVEKEGFQTEVREGIPLSPSAAITINVSLVVGKVSVGVCPNGAKVGTPTCWFNPGAFALPPPGQFGAAEEF
jgi:hypothetical protein